MASVLKVDTVLESTPGVGTNFGGVGSASVPTLSIGSQTNKGFYDAGSNKIGISVGGSKVGEIGVDYGGFTGNVVQVVNTVLTSNVVITGATSNNLRTTGIVGAITTKFTNSKIFIMINCAGVVGSLANYIYSIIYRHTSTWSGNTVPVGTSLVAKHVLNATSGSSVLLPHYQLDNPLQPAGTLLYYGNSISNNGTGTSVEINYDPAGFNSSRAYANITLMEVVV